MSKVLVVVESPAKAKTIGKFLGKRFFVKASMGHVRDLPKSQFGVEVNNGFSVKYITIRGKGGLLQELKSLAHKSDHVFLATDPDREGEAIAWHLKEFLKIPDGKKCRIEFNEITKKAITEAVKNPREVDMSLVGAQQARRVLDRLVGYNLSPLLWRKIRKGLSAGRVQSVVVRLICDREIEINSFVTEEYWSLTALLRKGKESFEAKLTKIDGKKAELTHEAQMDQIQEEIGHNAFKVGDIAKRQQRRNPSAPFITSTLQQEAYRKLNFTAKKTMIVAQQLYEGLDLSKAEGTVGLITYMRTDSVRASEEAQKEARDYIQQKFTQEFLPEKSPVYKGKGRVQGGHECIRPTLLERDPQSIKGHLSTEQYKLYKLIWERFLASQMAAAVVDVTTVDLTVKQYTFRANGSVIVFPGYTKIYIEGQDDKEKDETGLLPKLEIQDVVKQEKLVPKQHFTQPPPRYSEATLVKTLEEKGIGRPSTYAPILDTIITRGYVERRQKQYFPTDLGFLVVDLLKEYFKDLMDAAFTAKMEDELDAIEEGNTTWNQVLEAFYHPFAEQLEVADKEIEQIEVKDEVSDEICERCGRNMVIKSGRYGKFLACPGFPQCRNAKPILELTGAPCPRCETGKVVSRWSKKGRKFYGCNNYPQCDFVSWDEPAPGVCPECHSPLIYKRAGKNEEKIICTNKDCAYQIKGQRDSEA